ncbi:hypothetical protein [Chryseobacterium mucoviscidosis]|uniref:hypothetical protein n=1 Tax=Chryseobacterium mucoviscidosis TaxID=1945581 RepID=UPI0031DED1D4
MINFNIRYWDDNASIRGVIETPMLDLETEFPYIKYSPIDHNELLDPRKAKEVCENIDLLILDLLNEQELKAGEKPSMIGLQIIGILKRLKINIPVIVYSNALDEKDAEVSFTQLNKNYPDIVFIKKSDDLTAELLREAILKVIIDNLPDQFEVEPDYRDEFNQQLHFFGKKELNELLKEVKKIFSINAREKIKLDKMKSGFSGAILFRFNYENTEYILKVSKDVELLEKEFENSKILYGKFPSRFFNHIHREKITTSKKTSIGIIIKLIPDSTTLFDYILEENRTKADIDNMFNEIYFNYGLKDHYQKQIDSEKESWTSILKKFKDGRFTIIENMYKDLEPLLKNFNLSDVKNFAEKNFYEKLNDSMNKHEGTRTLNHLDLHSKNILIQGGKIPFLIDTGVMGYGYWSFDISRLLVDLFINGMDYKKKEFFDLNSIPKNISDGTKLISLEQIDYDGMNDRIIYSLNWLTSNAEAIYSDYFSKWELQLTLMKEFLQMAYRVETIPHSKRALSLELSQICMEEVSKNFN